MKTISVCIVLLWCLPVTAGEPCSGGSVDCCTNGGIFEDDINMASYDIKNVDDIYWSEAQSTDVAPSPVTVITAKPIYSGVANPTNGTGAPLCLAPSPGEETITGVTRAGTAGDTITIAWLTVECVAGTATITEGVDFTCAGAASDAACVVNIKAALTTAAPLLTYVCDDGTCSNEELSAFITPGSTAFVNMSSNDETNIAMSHGLDGRVVFTDGLRAYDRPNDYFQDVAAGWQFIHNSATIILASSAAVTIYKTVNLGTNYMYSTVGPLKLCGDFSTSHSLGTGAAGCTGAFEVDGKLWADGDVAIAGTVTFASKTVDYAIPAGHATLGPTAPTFVVRERADTLCFDADAEAVYLSYEVPDCWIGTSDISLRVYWVAESGDAPALNETVKWDAAYNSIVFGTEDIDVRVAATATVTYTETGNPGDDNDTHISTITLDYDSVTEPLTAGDTVLLQFDRDKTGDTYAGDACVVEWEFRASQNRRCDHY